MLKLNYDGNSTTLCYMNIANIHWAGRLYSLKKKKKRGILSCKDGCGAAIWILWIKPQYWVQAYKTNKIKEKNEH